MGDFSVRGVDGGAAAATVQWRRPIMRERERGPLGAPSHPVCNCHYSVPAAVECDLQGSFALRGGLGSMNDVMHFESDQ